MAHEHLETVKHLGDAAVIPSGIGVGIAYWMADVINPVLTGFVLISTLVWTIYRSIEIRRRLKQPPVDKT